MAERPSHDELGQLLFELGLAAAHAGDPDAAKHLERAAVAGGAKRLGALHWTAVLHLVAGRAAAAADVLESALRDVHEESRDAEPLIEPLLAAGLESTSVRRRLGDLMDHLTLPPGTPRTDFERFTLITLAFRAVPEQADAATATEYIRRALGVEEHGYYESVMCASVGRPMIAFVLALVDQLDEAEALLDRLVWAARDHGDRSAVGVFSAERAWIRVRARSRGGRRGRCRRGAQNRRRRHAGSRPRGRGRRHRRAGGPGARATARGARGGPARATTRRGLRHRRAGRPTESWTSSRGTRSPARSATGTPRKSPPKPS